MRPILILFLFFAAFSLPVFAQPGYWDEYVNGRFGFSVEVPPGFYGRGESDNGDGQTFYADDLSGKLSAGGGFIFEHNFEHHVAQWINWDKQDGWNISYQAIRPQWASWSGTKGNRILYRRQIPACGDSIGSYAGFRLEYERAYRDQYDPIIQRLVRTFAAYSVEWEKYEDQGVIEATVNTSLRCDQPARPKLKSRR